MTAAATIGYRERAAFYAVEHSDALDQPFLAELAARSDGPVVEIPCAAGRNLALLAAGGRPVIGIDREAAMVRAARHATADVTGIDVRRGDMRSFELDEPAALVLVPREAFQLLPTYADAAAALRCFHERLQPCGTVMLDLATFAAGGADEQHLHPTYFAPGVPDGQLVHDWVRPTSEGLLSRWHWQRQCPEAVTIGYRYELRLSALERRRFESTVRLLRYSRERISSLLERAGLRTRALLGDYEGRTYQPGSPRLVVLAGRKAA